LRREARLVCSKRHLLPTTCMPTPVYSETELTKGELQAKQRLVIVASSLGTVFEWYDFYIYGTLAVFFAGLFFPPGNAVTALLTSLLTFGVGFVVRPFGALFFGRIGDLVDAVMVR